MPAVLSSAGTGSTGFSMRAFKLGFTKFLHHVLVPTFFLLASSTWVLAQQAPPELGQETKGTPAVDETAPSQNEVTGEAVADQADEADVQSRSGIDGLLGKAEIIESKRESGQVYLIELEHSSGAKQYIEENDSDGKIESTSNDIEETPNLPKWKLGSW